MWPHMGVGEWGWLCDPAPRSRGSQVHGHTGHTWLHTHTHMHGHALTHLHSQPQCNSHTFQPRPHLPTPTCVLSVSVTVTHSPTKVLCTQDSSSGTHLKSCTATKVTHAHSEGAHTDALEPACITSWGNQSGSFILNTTKFNSSLHRQENWLYHPVGMGHALGSETSSQWALWPGLGHSWAVPGARLPLRPLAEPTQQSSRHLTSKSQDVVGKSQAWAGGTFLHHLLPSLQGLGPPCLPAR